MDQVKGFIILRIMPLWALVLLGMQVSGSENSGFSFNESEVEERILRMNISIDARYDRTVGAYIHGYVKQNRPKSEKILGHSNMYFPLFEEYLKAYNLPEDLKFIPIVESALDPNAVSSAGAVGLWQIMKGTARDLDLHISSYVDERRDPVKSTEAAVKYLDYLYNRFGDWTLVLAAYNAGPGTVSRAIRRANSTNFWALRKYLPVETRKYVPAFIAATYLMNYYYYHELEPDYPQKDFLYTESDHIFENTSFQRISLQSGTPVEIIEALNPAYVRHVIPKNQKGSPLVLPRDGMELYRASRLIPDHLRSPVLDANSVEVEEGLAYMESIVEKEYKVRAGDNLYNLARQFGCTVSDLMTWNNLHHAKLSIGQKLNIFVVEKLYISRTLLPVIPQLEPQYVEAKTTSSPYVLPVQEMQIRELPVSDGSYIYYVLKRRESLADVANAYRETTLTQLMEWNEINPSAPPSPGTRLRVGKRWETQP